MSPSTYLDAASGLPLHPAAREALLAAYDEGWADPTRLYASARRARQLLDGAVAALADGLGCRPDELRLAASHPAALYAGVRGVRAARARAGAHVVHTAVEHSAVLHAAAEGPATNVPVDGLGRVALDDLGAAVQPDTVLVAVQAANGEVGTTQPSPALDRPWLVDAAPVVGRAALPTGWSLLAASAAQWGGPALGLLAVRTGTRWTSPWPEEESPFPGPVPLPSVLAAAVALQAVLAERATEAPRLAALVDRVRAAAAAVPDSQVVGDPVDRLPHVLTCSFLYVDGAALVGALDALGFAVASGSSCTSSVLEPSHVLVAMGALSHGNVRVSLSRDTTAEDVDRFCAALPEVVARLRADAGVDDL